MTPNEWEKYKTKSTEEVLRELLLDEICKLKAIHGNIGFQQTLKQRKENTITYIVISVILSIFIPAYATSYLAIVCSLIYFVCQSHSGKSIKNLMAQARSNPDIELSRLIQESYYVVEDENHPVDRWFFVPVVIALCLLLAPLLATLSSAVRTAMPDQVDYSFRSSATLTTGSLTDGVYTWAPTDEGYILFTYDGWFSTSADIPASIEGKPVVAIAKYAFENETVLRSVSMPDSITEIGSYAFKGCTKLSTVKLSDHLTSLGGEAFYGCKRLISITIPAGVTEIRGNTFQSCGSLKTVTLHDGITDIHAYAFESCKAMESITLPSSITEIHANTFENCTALELIVIPEGVTRIAAHAFRKCSALSSVSVPSTVRSIGSSAFRECPQLRSIAIPEYCSVDERAFKDSPTWVSKQRFTPSPRPVQTPQPPVEEEDTTEETDVFSWTLTDRGYVLERYDGRSASVIIPAEVDGIPVVAIGDRAFEGNYKLTRISIPDSVTEIGAYAFNSCMFLSSIELSKNLTSIGDHAFLFSGLESVILPKGITEIRKNTFSWCDSLQSIVIPEGITRIDAYAFSYCESLTEATIPSTVKEVSYSAFCDCENLTRLEIPADCIIIASDGQERSSFYDCDAEIVRK